VQIITSVKLILDDVAERDFAMFSREAAAALINRPNGSR
jgi:hypothetical protein